MSPQIAAAPSLPKMELIPPVGAEVDGVFKEPGSPHDGRIIYTETVLDVEATKASVYDANGDLRIKLDANGKEVWKKAQGTGEPLYPILVKDTHYKTIRYILNAQEVGRNVKKVYNFEMTDEERATLARQDKERNFLDEFVKAAIAEGYTAQEVVSKIMADTLTPGEEEGQAELDVSVEDIEQIIAGATDMIGRPDDEEDVEGITEAEKPKSQRRRKRK